jgi:hypothetical protein
VPTGSICGGHKEAETEPSNVYNNNHSGHFFLLYVSKKLRVRCTNRRPYLVFSFIVWPFLFYQAFVNGVNADEAMRSHAVCAANDKGYKN